MVRKSDELRRRAGHVLAVLLGGAALAGVGCQRGTDAAPPTVDAAKGADATGGLEFE